MKDFFSRATIMSQFRDVSSLARSMQHSIFHLNCDYVSRSRNRRKIIKRQKITRVFKKFATERSENIFQRELGILMVDFERYDL